MDELNVQSRQTWHFPLQFRLRTLLIAVTGVAVILGYWVALPRALPPWQRLLVEINEAQALVAKEGLLSKGEAFSGRGTASKRAMLVGLLVMAAFYWVKVAIPRTISCKVTALFAFALLVCFLLPYIYLHWEEWDNPHVVFMGNWLGMPIALLAVPTVSFLNDLLASRPRKCWWLVLRSCLELFVATPLWGLCWIYFSFFSLGFGWI